MFAKIDIRDIVRDHWKTLVRYGEPQRAAIGDIVLFYGFPVLIAGALAWTGVDLGTTGVMLVVGALAIFAGLLLNLLLLIHGLVRHYSGPTGDADARLLLEGLYANIAYAVFVALAILVLTMVESFVTYRIVSVFLQGLVFLGLANFTLTLLMILKRVHAVLGHEFRRGPDSNA